MRERWAVTGPNGLVAWKQRRVGLSAHLEGVNRRGEAMLAAIAGEKAWNGFASLGGGGGLPCNRGFMGSLGATSVRLATAGKDFCSALRHQGKAFGLDPEAQHDAGLALLGLLGGALVLLLWSSRARAWVLLPIPGSPKFSPHSSLLAPHLRPFGPWGVPVMRHAARTMVLVFLFPCGMLLAPVPVQALTCEQVFYPLTDHLGSVSTLTDMAGAVVMTRHFLPFGESFESEAPTVASCNNNEPWPYGFTGQFHDAETGLIYMHARYYNSAIGHFMTPDSVVPNPDDTYSYDRYAYCRNNPVNLTDPTGHFWNIIIGALIGGIMAAINGQNILAGMAMGALAGAVFGAAAWAPNALFSTITAGAIFGGMSSSMNGGDGFKGMIIGAAGAAIGYGVGQMVGPKGMDLQLHKFGQGVLAVMSGGTVGGLSSAAMGGDFWQGFTMGAASAGLSYAANATVQYIEQAAAENDAYAAFLVGKGSLPGLNISSTLGANGCVLSAGPGNSTPGSGFVKATFDKKLADYLQWYTENVARAEIAVTVFSAGSQALPTNIQAIFFIENAAPVANDSSQAMMRLFSEAVNTQTKSYTWTHWLHVHPPPYFHVPTPHLWTEYAHGSLQTTMHPAGVERLGSGPSNPGDYQSYPELAHQLGSFHPSLGVLDSQKQYYEIPY